MKVPDLLNARYNHWLRQGTQAYTSSRYGAIMIVVFVEISTEATLMLVKYKPAGINH